VGQIAWQVVGRINQTGPAFVAYGYLSTVAGLPAALLVGNPIKHTESSAHLTLIMRGHLQSRSVVGNLFVLDVTGSATIHVQASGGASFASVGSFGRGPAIAKFSVSLQSIVNVQAPNQGILQISADLQQGSARAFNLAGHTYQLGRAGQGACALEIEPRGQVVDAGRTAVSRAYRGRERRIVLALIGRAGHEIYQRGHLWVASLLAPGMIRLHRQLGLELNILGPPRMYLGAERFPVRYGLIRTGQLVVPRYRHLLEQS
jgi:hypothetical protein